MKNTTKLLDLATRFIAIGILGYSAFLKLSSAPAAVHIFERINMEATGRYCVAGLELLTIALLLFHKTAWRGAILGMVLMFSAIIVHILTNEFEVLGDKGLMFGSAIVTFFCCISILINQADMEAEFAKD
ncbi:MAG TPA: hypothetical protein PKM51_01690 [Chitinophagales bacterium]|nr:hypothetical protein [Chitinophagales bacterium]HNM31434.1 hypothetical protein [Chitinophagales bacterium]